MNLRQGAFHIIFVSILLLTAAIGAVGIDYVFWTMYVGGLENTQTPKSEAFEAIPGVSPQTLRRLGRILRYKKSSFVNFGQRKAPGIIRIGAFGNSFTYGDEVDEQSDYPSQLQELLKESGFPNVEVLNFGSSWHGFGQAHIMWTEVGRYYNLDYILLGPGTFFPERDTQFNHTYDIYPYYFHSRYILSGDGLRLIDVPGQSSSERFHNYYSFIPAWRILRYDRSDPAFLAAVLPSGRHVGNPFYYDKRSASAEAVEIRRRLLRDMKKAGMPILLAVYPWMNGIGEAISDLESERFCIARFDQLKRFPYQAPKGHNSRVGNALLASQYLSALLGRPVGKGIVNTSDVEMSSALPTVDAKLSSFGIFIKLNDVNAGEFFPAFEVQSPAKKPSFLRDGQINSLVGLKAPKSSVLDGVFLASTSDIPAGAPVRIVMRSSHGSQSADLGLVRPLANGVNLGQADLPGLEIREASFSDRRIVIKLTDLSSLFRDISLDMKLQIFVGDRVVLEGTGSEEDGAFALRPLSAELLILRSTGNELNFDDGMQKGNVDIVLLRGLEAHQIPVARWWIEKDRQSDPSAGCTGGPLWAPDRVLTANPIKIVVTASGDQFDGAPQLRVYLNGKSVGEAEVTAVYKADEWQTFTFSAALADSTAVLELELANDKYDEATKQDRNLYIRDVSVGLQKLRPEDALITGQHSDAVAGAVRPIYSGSLMFALPPGNAD